MNDKQILDRLESINLSLRQKKDLIDVIKDITGNNSSNDNGSNDNKLYVYVNVVEQKILINDVEYEFSESNGEGYGDAMFTIKNETLYNYINNYFDKNYYAYMTTVVSSRKHIIYQKGKYPLSHTIYENGDCFDIVVIFDYYALLRIIK